MVHSNSIVMYRLSIIFGAYLFFGSCSPPAPSRGQALSKEAQVALEAGLFIEDAKTRRDIAEMDVQAAHERLGSFHYEGLTQIAVTLGGQSQHAQEKTSVHVDAQGHRETKIETARGRIEQIWIGEAVYVRYGGGHLRQKSPREMDPQEFSDQSFDALRQALVTAGPLAWEGPTDSRLDGILVKRYTAQQRAPLNRDTTLEPRARKQDRLPKTLLGAWHSAATLTRVSAQVDLDATTAVILDSKVMITFKAQLEHREPFEVSLRHERHVTQVGAASEVRVPAQAVAEYRRVLHERNALRFFKDALPKGGGNMTRAASPDDAGEAEPAAPGETDGPEGAEENVPEEATAQ